MKWHGERLEMPVQVRGTFFESLNAAGVHQIPMVISVWDDEYGISVDNSYQTIKGVYRKH